MEEEIIKNLNDELEEAIEHEVSALRQADIEERFDELKTEAELLIRKHPLASVVAGFVAGYVIGKILR